MKVNITFSEQTGELIDQLIEMGIYGRTRSEVIRRFAEERLQQMVINRFTKEERRKAGIQ